MYRRAKTTWLIVLILGCGLGTAACGGNDGAELARTSQPLAPQRAELVNPADLPLPSGVEPALWKQLTDELERQLLALPGSTSGPDGVIVRTASTPPQSEASRTALSRATSQFRWGFYSQGDYDQNGEVNAADLVPLAKQFHESALPNRFPPQSVQAVVDGDSNGEINLGDVTPIAVNFHNTLVNYNLYRSSNPADYPDSPLDNNGGAAKIAEVALGQAFGESGQQRLEFVSNVPLQLDNDLFWVRPADTDGAEGIASNMAGPYSNAYTLDGYVYMAGGGTDPLPGVVVELSGDAEATATTDLNGHFVFETVFNGEYVVTPTGDPYGYAPAQISVTVSNEDQTLAPIVQAPVDISHCWGLDYNAAMGVSTAVQLDSMGNIYVSGGLHQDGPDLSYLLKLDMFGELVWYKVFDCQAELVSLSVILNDQEEIYSYGVYSTVNNEVSDSWDLLLMKLDSEGNITWDMGYRYPQADGESKEDFSPNAWFDASGNFCVSGLVRTTEVPVFVSDRFLIRISPAGEVVEQSLLKSSIIPDVSVMADKLLPVSGGTITGGYAALPGLGRSLMLKLNDDGGIGWSNSWGPEGDFQVIDLDSGADGMIYISGTAYHSSNPDDSGVQLARFNQQGEPDWDLFYNSESDSIFPNTPRLAVGQLGKLWVAGMEYVIPEGPDMTVFPFVWSFQPEDGGPRFSRLWECAGNLRSTNATILSALAVNQYGVAVICAEAPSHLGEWRQHEVSSSPASWSYSHPEFTFTAETPGPLHEVEPSQPEDTLVMDPDPSLHVKHLVMLYRP